MEYIHREICIIFQAYYPQVLGPCLLTCHRPGWKQKKPPADQNLGDETIHGDSAIHVLDHIE